MNQNVKKPYKKIFSKKIAYKLRREGFNILTTEVNFKRPEETVYLFEATPELFEALTRFTQESRTKK